MECQRITSVMRTKQPLEGEDERSVGQRSEHLAWIELSVF